MLGGETLAKLVRGAGRSVLVLPAAAAFQRFDQPEPESESNWVQKVDGLSHEAVNEVH
jgi:hypothetical protein